MSVTITKTAGRAVEITWAPEDDPHGYLARAVEGDQLAYALEALGDGASLTEYSVDAALQAAMHTKALAKELDRRAAKQVVTLREQHGLSWGQIATVVLDDAARQSAVRRMYESGLRHLGR
ncbi:hypothetical protein [Streptomyces sp. NPDC008125]|uniref:hypothetical protein n=1 Tax=Streptomyces sp. NPDC008125 TaxID=3364811 RepID=UPI0036ED6420